MEDRQWEESSLKFWVLAFTGVIPWEQPSMAPTALSLYHPTFIMFQRSVCTFFLPWILIPPSLQMWRKFLDGISLCTGRKTAKAPSLPGAPQNLLWWTFLHTQTGFCIATASTNAGPMKANKQNLNKLDDYKMQLFQILIPDLQWICLLAISKMLWDQ